MPAFRSQRWYYLFKANAKNILIPTPWPINGLLKSHDVNHCFFLAVLFLDRLSWCQGPKTWPTPAVRTGLSCQYTFGANRPSVTGPSRSARLTLAEKSPAKKAGCWSTGSSCSTELKVFLSLTTSTTRMSRRWTRSKPTPRRTTKRRNSNPWRTTLTEVVAVVGSSPTLTLNILLSWTVLLAIRNAWTVAKEEAEIINASAAGTSCLSLDA